MQLTLRGGRTRTGLATGAVQITVRNRATDGSTKQTIQLSCDQARYTAGATRDKGRIDLEGNVRSKTYTSGFDGPITLNGAKGYVEFLDAENTRVQIDQGSSSFTPIEPAPAPRKK
ncbi:MAG: hypothetical protein H7Z41_11150 [Cytophagales bacterium]|nr:hypothetical protein [Armatimonadota bacterium]